MDLKTWVFLLGGAVAAISLSCGIKSAFSDSEEEEPALRGTHQQVKANRNHDEAPVAQMDDEKEEQKEPDASEPFVRAQPLDPTPEGDFIKIDANGVTIERKGGMVITRISAKEVYYLPDEF